MTSAVKRLSNSSRHFWREISPILYTAATSSSTEEPINPVTPWRRTSGTEPHGLAITGVPQASASIITSPNGSGQSTGKSGTKGDFNFFLALLTLTPRPGNRQHRVHLGSSSQRGLS